MKTINLFLLISILLVFSISAKTQNNCYIQLGDLSGFNTAPYQAELEAAACELIQAFPSEFQEQFKVYSFGFYAHNEYMQGGFEEAFQKVADEIQTPYYLVIGRQTDHTGIYSRFWVELELPTRNNFKCYNQDYINKVEFQIIKSISDFHLKLDKIPELYFKSEIIGIHFLEKTINEMVECCNHDNIIRGVCSLCSWSFQDIIDYYEVNSFITEECEISQNIELIDSSCICFTECPVDPLFLEGNKYRIYHGTNLSVFTVNNEEIALNTLFADILELGKLYEKDDITFFGALTDQSIFYSSNTETSIRSSDDLLSLNDIEQKFMIAQKGIWISVSYTNKIAKYHIKTKGIDLLIKNSNVDIFEVLRFVGNKKEIESLESLRVGVLFGHFHQSIYKKLFELLQTIETDYNQDPILHRLAYISEIEKISKFLSYRHSDYGEIAKYLNSLLEPMTYEEYFSPQEVYRVYKLSYNIYLECKGRTMISIFGPPIKTFKPFIEFALIETGFFVFGELYTIGANASWKTISLLPQSIKNPAKLVWDRITFSSSYRPNSLIPETFKLTTKTKEQFYIQYSATDHLHQLVLKKNAYLKPWYESQKALRSQLVLEDFAKAVDDILTKNPNLQMNTKYYSGKWEVMFGSQTNTVQSDGLRRIYHALSTSQ